MDGFWFYHHSASDIASMYLMPLRPGNNRGPRDKDLKIDHGTKETTYLFLPPAAGRHSVPSRAVSIDTGRIRKEQARMAPLLRRLVSGINEAC